MGKNPTQMIEKLKLMDSKKLNTLPWYFRLNNSQAFDFNYVNNLEEEFDFVLVLERFQEQ